MSTVKDLLHPIGLLWVGLLVTTVLALRKKAWTPAASAAALAAFFYLVGASPLPARLLAGLERPYDRAMNAPIASADAVVMLGGTHAFSRRELIHLSVENASNRILTALELIREGKAKNFVLGGSFYKYQGLDRPDSELIIGWATAWKLPVGRLFPLGICRDTHDEAVRTMDLAVANHWRKVLLVTSANHMRRGEATFRKVGVDVIPVACEFSGLAWLEGDRRWYYVPRIDGFLLLGHWMYEQLGWGWYWWKGWV